jgi:hypothetical protein
MAKHCCLQMETHLKATCKVHADRRDCPDALIDYVAKFDEYGLIIHDGGSSSISIAYCPWCGNRLPPPKRDRWFNELEAMGFDDPYSQEIPEAYQSDAWYRA